MLDLHILGIYNTHYPQLVNLHRGYYIPKEVLTQRNDTVLYWRWYILIIWWVRDRIAVQEKYIVPQSQEFGTQTPKKYFLQFLKSPPPISDSSLRHKSWIESVLHGQLKTLIPLKQTSKPSVDTRYTRKLFCRRPGVYQISIVSQSGWLIKYWSGNPMLDISNAIFFVLPSKGKGKVALGTSHV